MLFRDGDYKAWARVQRGLFPLKALRFIETALEASKGVLDVGADLTSIAMVKQLSSAGCSGCVILPRRSGLKVELLRQLSNYNLNTGYVKENGRRDWAHLQSTGDTKFDFVRLLNFGSLAGSIGTLLPDILDRMDQQGVLCVHPCNPGNEKKLLSLLSEYGVEYTTDREGEVLFVRLNLGGVVAEPPPAAKPDLVYQTAPIAESAPELAPAPAPEQECVSESAPAPAPETASESEFDEQEAEPVESTASSPRSPAEYTEDDAESEVTDVSSEVTVDELAQIESELDEAESLIGRSLDEFDEVSDDSEDKRTSE